MTPLVLELVEHIFAVGAITIKLCDRHDLVVRIGARSRQIQRRHEHGVLPDRRVLFHVSETQAWLASLIARLGHDTILQPTSQHDDTTMTTPSRQAQVGLLPLPALAGVMPAAAQKRALYQGFDVLGQAQLEQISKAASLGFSHRAFARNAAVAAQKRRLAVARNAIQQRP